MEWQKERSIVDSVRGAVDPMNLWTDFGDDTNHSPDVINININDNNDDVKKNTNTYNQPYNQQQQYRGNQGNNRHRSNQQYWRGYQNNRQRPYYRGKKQQQVSKESMKENVCEMNVFFNDEFVFADDEFSTVVFENEQFVSETKAAS